MSYVSLEGIVDWIDNGNEMLFTVMKLSWRKMG